MGSARLDFFQRFHRAEVEFDFDFLRAHSGTNLNAVVVSATFFEGGFVVSTESSLCNHMSELEVFLDDETTLLRIIITEDGSTTEPEDEVSVDDVVSVTGTCDDESLIADVVLVIEDQRIED